MRIRENDAHPAVAEGHVIGLQPGLRIASVTEEGLLVLPRGRNPLRYTDETQAWRAHRLTTKRIRASQHLAPFSEQANYIALPAINNVQRPAVSDSTLPYLRDLRSEREESESESSSGTEFEDSCQETKARIVDSRRAVASNPDDVNAWMELCRLQDEQVNRRLGRAPSDAKAPHRSVREAQMAVLDEGIKTARTSRARMSLELERARLAQSSGLWDCSKIEKHFLGLIPLEMSPLSGDFETQDQIRALRSFLSWRATEATQWNIEDVMKWFEKAIAWASRKDAFNTELVAIQVQAAAVLAEAGYRERAFAIFQAQLQMIQTQGESWEDRLARVEVDWNGEQHPRFGEPFDLASVHAHTPGSLADPIEKWYHGERARSKAHILPTRATDDPLWQLGETELDPFSTIFFSDIKAFLINVDDQEEIVRSLLQHLNVPAETTGFTTLQSSYHSLMSLDWQEMAFWPPPAAASETSSALQDPYRFPLLSLPASDALSVIPRRTDAPYFTNFTIDKLDRDNLRIAKSVAEAAHNHLASLLLALGDMEASVSKNAKSLFKGEHRKDARCWVAYALAEFYHGRQDTALKTLSMVVTTPDLTVPKPLDAAERAQAWCFLVLALGPGPKISALCLAAKLKFALTTPAQLEEAIASPRASPIDTQRARRFFREDQTTWKASVICLLQLEMELASSGQDVVDRLREVEQLIERPERAGPDADLVRIRFWSLAFEHNRRRQGWHVSPADMRTMLIRACAKSPSVSLPALLAAHEVPRRFEGQWRLALERDILGKLQDSDTLVSEALFAFAAYAEAHLYPHHPNEHATRRMLERGVEMVPQ